MKHLGEKTSHEDCEGRAICCGDIVELTRAGSGLTVTGQVVPRFSGFSVAVKGGNGRIVNYIGSTSWRMNYRIRTVTPYDQVPGLEFTPDDNYQRAAPKPKDETGEAKAAKRKAREIADVSGFGAKKRQWDIKDFTDEALADELRSRGYSGTLERHTTLSV